MSMRDLKVETVAEAYLLLLKDRGIDHFFGNAGTDFASLVDAFAKFEAEGTPAQFRSVAFVKLGGLKPDRQETCFAFRHAGAWVPEAASRWKQFRHDPVMFKIQIQRPIVEMERRGVKNPTQTFLNVFLPEFERQLAASQIQETIAPAPAAVPAPSGGG